MASMTDLCDRYRVKKSAMTAYLQRHLHEINVDGQHAYMARGCWSFDEVAVKRIDKLRGFGVANVIEKVESDEIKSLKITVDNLQTSLLKAQQQTTLALERAAEAEKEHRLLAERTKADAAELATLRERTKNQKELTDHMKKEIEELKSAKAAVESERDQAKTEADKIKNAGFFARMFKRF